MVVNDDNDDGTKHDLDRGGRSEQTPPFALLSAARWFPLFLIQLKRVETCWELVATVCV